MAGLRPRFLHTAAPVSSLCAMTATHMGRNHHDNQLASHHEDVRSDSTAQKTEPEHTGCQQGQGGRFRDAV